MLSLMNVITEEGWELSRQGVNSKNVDADYSLGEGRTVEFS